ncbi:integrase arm-type DNA-binding domain-containing protein, partial [Klebsiella pneumoniae]|uniref:integrase arm-type DNA-binding domain-containing protein n=1 Tax=Klebsiella pneumoniae TaxID=573 RepID=UPI0027305F23
GPFPEVGLAEARDLARDFRAAVREGRDPIAEREEARQSLIEQQQREISFEDAARACHRAKQPEFRSTKHAKDWISALERHAFPLIGSRP